MNIYEEDSWQECARKIFYHFKVGQTVSFEGTGEDCKGIWVIDELKRLDEVTNKYVKGGKLVRKLQQIPGSIGGYIAHKIFKYRVGDKKVHIWRIQ